MLTCLPKSLCSWNFRVLGAAAGDAELTFNFLSEQGTIALGGLQFTVVKHGWLSGRWTLESGAGVYAEANKRTMIRSFQLQAGNLEFTAQAASPLTRCYEISSANAVRGTIQPVHPFTRRTIIECDSSVPELVQLFAFWLAALTWKRAAQKNNNV